MLQQLLRLGCKGAAAATAASVSASCSSAVCSKASTSGFAQQQIQNLGKFGSAQCRNYSNPPKSMLNSSIGMGSTSHAMEEAAEARLNKIKAAGHAADAADAGHGAQQGAVSRALRFITNTLALTGVGMGALAGYYTYAYDTKEVEQMVDVTKKELSTAEGQGNVVREAWVHVAEKYLNARKWAEGQVKTYTDPTYHKLLPDMAPELKGRVKTLVLDLDDLLVHKEWTRQQGWRLYKRPGVQDFLLEMGQYYELVLFTDQPATYAEPILSRLDPHRVIMYRLHRPETQYHDGKHVRDLSKLNRELSQVLMISANPDAYKFQPENTIKLKPWTHDQPADTTLIDLIPMLKMIAERGIRDTRDVVKSYDGEEDVAKAFKLRMQHVAEHQRQTKQRGFLSVGK